MAELESSVRSTTHLCGIRRDEGGKKEGRPDPQKLRSLIATKRGLLRRELNKEHKKPETEKFNKMEYAVNAAAPPARKSPPRSQQCTQPRRGNRPRKTRTSTNNAKKRSRGNQLADMHTMRNKLRTVVQHQQSTAKVNNTSAKSNSSTEQTKRCSKQTGRKQYRSSGVISFENKPIRSHARSQRTTNRSAGKTRPRMQKSDQAGSPWSSRFDARAASHYHYLREKKASDVEREQLIDTLDQTADFEDWQTSIHRSWLSDGAETFSDWEEEKELEVRGITPVQMVEAERAGFKPRKFMLRRRAGQKAPSQMQTQVSMPTQLQAPTQAQAHAQSQAQAQPQPQMQPQPQTQPQTQPLLHFSETAYNLITSPDVSSEKTRAVAAIVGRFSADEAERILEVLTSPSPPHHTAHHAALHAASMPGEEGEQGVEGATGGGIEGSGRRKKQEEPAKQKERQQQEDEQKKEQQEKDEDEEAKKERVQFEAQAISPVAEAAAIVAAATAMKRPISHSPLQFVLPLPAASSTTSPTPSPPPSPSTSASTSTAAATAAATTVATTAAPTAARKPSGAQQRSLSPTLLKARAMLQQGKELRAAAEGGAGAGGGILPLVMTSIFRAADQQIGGSGSGSGSGNGSNSINGSGRGHGSRSNNSMGGHGCELEQQQQQQQQQHGWHDAGDGGSDRGDPAAVRAPAPGSESESELVLQLGLESDFGPLRVASGISASEVSPVKRQGFVEGAEGAEGAEDETVTVGESGGGGGDVSEVGPNASCSQSSSQSSAVGQYQQLDAFIPSLSFGQGGRGSGSSRPADGEPDSLHADSIDFASSVGAGAGAGARVSIGMAGGIASGLDGGIRSGVAYSWQQREEEMERARGAQLQQELQALQQRLDLDRSAKSQARQLALLQRREEEALAWRRGQVEEEARRQQARLAGVERALEARLGRRWSAVSMVQRMLERSSEFEHAPRLDATHSMENLTESVKGHERSRRRTGSQAQARAASAGSNVGRERAVVQGQGQAENRPRHQSCQHQNSLSHSDLHDIKTEIVEGDEAWRPEFYRAENESSVSFTVSRVSELCTSKIDELLRLGAEASTIADVSDTSGVTFGASVARAKDPFAAAAAAAAAAATIAALAAATATPATGLAVRMAELVAQAQAQAQMQAPVQAQAQAQAAPEKGIHETDTFDQTSLAVRGDLLCTDTLTINRSQLSLDSARDREKFEDEAQAQRQKAAEAVRQAALAVGHAKRHRYPGAATVASFGLITGMGSSADDAVPDAVAASAAAVANMISLSVAIGSEGSEGAFG